MFQTSVVEGIREAAEVALSEDRDVWAERCVFELARADDGRGDKPGSVKSEFGPALLCPVPFHEL